MPDGAVPKATARVTPEGQQGPVTPPNTSNASIDDVNAVPMVTPACLACGGLVTETSTIRPSSGHSAALPWVHTKMVGSLV